MNRSIQRAIPTAVVALIAILIPLFLNDETFYVQTVLAAVVVVGLSLFMGYAGQASLGQGAFVAIGALTVAVSTVSLHVPPLIALIAAPLISAGLAYLLGLPLLRLRGHYLAFGTLAVLLLVGALMGGVPILGGGAGIVGIPSLGIGSLVVTGQLFFAYLALAVLAITMVVSHNVISSRFGRGVRAVAGSESAAASSGVPVLRTKLAVFALAGGCAGLVGGITAFFIPYVSAESFPPSMSFTYVIMAVIGGLGTLWGGVVGTVLVSVLVQALNTISNVPGTPPIVGTILQYAAYAIILILFLLYMPRGLWPTVGGAVKGRLTKRVKGSQTDYSDQHA